MNISSQMVRPAMRSGASSVAAAGRPDPQVAQVTQASQTSSTDATKQKNNQFEAQYLNLGLNMDFKA